MIFINLPTLYFRLVLEQTKNQAFEEEKFTNFIILLHQLIGDEEIVQAPPLPPLKGSFFKWAGGGGFQRPFELATLRLRNMGEVLTNWKTYVPNPAYLTQRGATFLFNDRGELLYEHRDRAILGFAADMSDPLSFLTDFVTPKTESLNLKN